MAAAAIPEVFETGAEPEYFVSKIKTEDAGSGNVRVLCYKVVHGSEWHLLYTAIVPSLELMAMGKQLVVAGAEAHNSDNFGFGIPQ